MPMTLSVIISSILLLFLGVPVAVSLGLSSLITLIAFHTIPLDIIPQLLWGGTESFILIAIPFFIMVGVIMELGGISNSLISLANSLVGWMKGGLGAANIVVSLIFGGISGSSVADTVSIGTIMIPKMVENGYDKEYSAAITAVSSILSVIVPPSILMVVLGAVAGQSIGRLLVGGILPGVLLSFIMIVQNYFISRKRDYGTYNKFSLKNIWMEFKGSILALGTPLIILGGILSGIVTPTEASGVAVLYTIFVTMFLKKRDFLDIFIKATRRAAVTTSSVIFVMLASKLFTFIITFENVPQLASSAALGVTKNPLVILLIFNVFMIIVGMFTDAIVAILICAPIMYPVIMHFGIDPIHFGVLFVLCLAIGLVTPPFGVCLFSVCNVAKIKLGTLVRGVLPLYVSLLVTILLITVFPQIVLLLPNAFLK